MSRESAEELFRLFREGQIRYSYFLLAAAAAAIALAVNQTDAVGLRWSQMPLAAAVAMWGASFYAGCRHVVHMNNMLFTLYTVEKIRSDLQPEFFGKPHEAENASREYRQLSTTHYLDSIRFGRWQFGLLVLGALFYLVWHVIEMWLVSQPN